MAQPAVSSAFVAAPGARLYVESAGDRSRPVLLFIHAGIAHCAMWDPQFDEFARDHFVIRYDTRGFGKTDTTDMAFSNRQDVIAVLDHFGVDKAVLIGCSRGGQIALDTTLEFPERVRALVSVCGGISGFAFEPDPSHPLFEITSRLFAEAEAAEEAGEWERLTQLEARIWADGLGQPEGRCGAEARDKVIAMCRFNYARLTPAGQPIQLDPPAAGRLKEVRAPALIVLGELDTPATQLMAQAMHAGISNAQLATLSNTAHVPSMEWPDAFNVMLREFLDALVGGS